MAIAPDPLFGIQPQALSLWQRRAEVIAANLANADTPHYLAREIDFRQVFAAAAAPDKPLALSQTAAGHQPVDHQQGADSSGGVALRYRVPQQPAMDGNTVDTDVELAAFAENGIRYQASLTFLDAQVRMLRLAISGDA